MGFTPATRDAILGGTSLEDLANYASLHTADPGGTGANEIVGGSYVRVPIVWDPPSGGTQSFTAPVTLQIPIGVNFTHFGFWVNDVGGTFVGGDALDALQSYPTGGTYDLDVTVNTT